MIRSRSHLQLLLLLVLVSMVLLTACAGGQPGASPTTVPPSPMPTQLSGEPVRFGVLANRSAVAVTQEWSPLLAHLSQVMGRPFQLLPLKPEEILPAIEQHKLDVVASNSVQSVQAQRFYGAQLLASFSYPKTGPYFAGLILVRRDSSIQQLADLKGKRLAIFSRTGTAAAYAFQTYHLVQHGMDPEAIFSSVSEVGSQDNVVLALLNRTADVGYVRTGQLEKMLKDGLITSLDDLRILDRADDFYPYPHTTVLYPEWFVFSTAKTDTALAAQLQKTLLELPQGHEAMAAVGLDKFVPPVDTTAITTLITTLKLPGWDMQANH
jgi:two-component system, LuxR family, sensor histidine kinase TtrS